MNVQEVEKRTGLTRANIRFYEKQGLLKPLRKENGYRDYSTDDVGALLKIKLMRELDISIEEIDKLQKEENSLISVIEKRAEMISEERESLLDSKAVCQAIQQENVSFSELEAEKYLEELERLARERGVENAGEFKRKQDAIHETRHPWRRLFARMIDESIYNMVIMLIFYLGFHGKDSFAWIICATLIGMAMTVLAEATLLTCFGTTVGKWLFGIRVLSKNGKKLSWQEAAVRTGTVLWRGEAFNIPIWDIYRLYKSYDVYTNEAALPWDSDCLYLMDEKKGVRYGAAIFVVWAVLILDVGFHFPSEEIYKLPEHYGSLTVEEFADNYNKYLELYGLADKEYLDHNGKWAKPGALKPHFVYELKGDTIKSISFEIDYDGNEKNPYYMDEVACALLAWEGGEHRTLWGLLGSERIPDIEEAVDELKKDIYNRYKGPGEVCHEVIEMYGYQCVDGGLFPQSDTQEGKVHISFKIS